jgi:hypothetical protein
MSQKTACLTSDSKWLVDTQNLIDLCQNLLEIDAREPNRRGIYSRFR